jgi:hypothetical protein
VLAEPVPDGELWPVAEVDGEAVGDAQAQLHEPVTDAALQAGLDAGRRRGVPGTWSCRPSAGAEASAVACSARSRSGLRTEGAELLVTDTSLRSNVGALEFYESHGFEQQAVIFRKPLA